MFIRLLKLPIKLVALPLHSRTGGAPFCWSDCAGAIVRHHKSAGNGISSRLIGRMGCSCSRCHALPDYRYRCILRACAAYRRMAAGQGHGYHALRSGLYSDLISLLSLFALTPAFHRAEARIGATGNERLPAMRTKFHRIVKLSQPDGKQEFYRQHQRMEVPHHHGMVAQFQVIARRVSFKAGKSFLVQCQGVFIQYVLVMVVHET